MKNKQIIISLGILAAILIAGVFGGDKPPLAQAGSSQNVSGFAWSENIGWISFNSNDCDTDKNGYVDSGLCGGDNSTKQAFDYGVNIDPTTGAFSGWAWSENIGWIYFGSAFQIIVRIAPEEPRQWAKLDLATNQVSGWAKAWAGGSDGSGGWDGWIKMSDVGNINFNWIDSNGTHNGVIRNDCKLQGYAWGSDVIGWIQFDPVNVDCQNIPSNPPGVITTLPPTQNQPPTVTLTANPSTIDSGQSSTLIWTTTNDPTSCVAAGDWSGSKSAGGGTESVSPISNSTYSITCSKTGFSDVSSLTTVTVNTPACGDGTCDVDESCLSCESDCGSCPPPPPPPPPELCPDGSSQRDYLACEQGICKKYTGCKNTDSACSGKAENDQCVSPTFREI